MGKARIMIKPTPSIVYDSYWYLAAERQNIFFKRLNDELGAWTNDPILQKHKFTNAYRASDRVSQYLIKNVIYTGSQDLNEVFFRIILFKLFNKIETWELLKEKLTDVSFENFNYSDYEAVLSTAMTEGKKIYSAAYIMASGAKVFGSRRKHQSHLKLIQMMMDNHLSEKMCNSKSMGQAYELLLAYPMIGSFLAYQFVTDINYSEITNFSEMSYVMPGPGALNGIKKCFTSLGDYSAEGIIKMMADIQEKEFERLGIDFKTLWGRQLQLIDCQNIFCETDKYARVKFPDVQGQTKRSRIKQIFKINSDKFEPWYPPKWNINSQISLRNVVNV
ncbi:MAG: hypothetical protein GY931_05135 [Maribacter sp.]|nr:hypothetical protein [Maribacter sp.]